MVRACSIGTFDEMKFFLCEYNLGVPVNGVGCWELSKDLDESSVRISPINDDHWIIVSSIELFKYRSTSSVSLE